MKKFVVAATAIAAFGFVNAASAADMPVKAPAIAPSPVYDWSGIYVGVNGGWASGTLDWTWVPPSTATNSEGRSMSGGLGGGHIGIQWQFDNRLVLGVEANVLAARMKASPVCVVNAAFTCGSNVDRLWTVGPRAGFAMNNVLLYGTGGYASGRIYTDAVSVATGALFESAQQWHNGWFAGIGAEYGITPNIIAGIEATHVRLNTKTHVPVSATTGAAIPADSHDVGARFTGIRARLSYKFGLR